MRCTLPLLVIGAACGDNHVAITAPADAPTAAYQECAVTSGTAVAMRKIVWGCYVEGAPAFPGCVDQSVTLVTSPPHDPRLFLLGQFGTIRIVKAGVLVPEPFLDLTTVASPLLVDVEGCPGCELGVLGLVFDPSYAETGTFYVSYTASNPGDPDWPYLDVVVRYRASDDPDRADPASAELVLAIPDYAANHNGGMMEFGPDGYLYISTGDGGDSYDDHHTAQDPHALLGKMLRIDVHTTPYSIPIDNPFSDGVAGAREVFMLGLRNPWRFAFDRATSDLWIADVGQALWEELDVIPRIEQRGANLGWSAYEGNQCLNGPCDVTGKRFPDDARSHDDGWCAIIGGEVYRGSCYPDLVGAYFYTDYCKHGLAAARHSSSGITITDLPGDFPEHPTSLHGDAAGELYLADTDGNVFHLEGGPAASMLDTAE
jgi:glucose/arabinose dehydrogenase